MQKFKHLKPPYANTSVPASKSKGQIEEMLKEFGAVGLRWTETPGSMQGKECPILEFILETEIGGVKKRFGIRIHPPLVADRKRANGRWGPLVTSGNLNASMRILHWYVKARLEAALVGLEDITETFMSKIMMSLPDGTITTMGEVVKERPQLITGMLPSFEIVQPRLEGKVIDVNPSE